jgi:response regulator NasT
MKAAEHAQAQQLPQEPTDDASALEALVPMAVGVLMHRFSLNRPEALARLRKLAAAEMRSVAAQAQRVVLAVEELAATRDA